MQLPVQADPPELQELAEKLRAIEPPLAEGCDGSAIERDRGKLIATILPIVVVVKDFIAASVAYKQHWPKGRGSRWGRAFALIASSLGSSTRTLYRLIKSMANGVVPDRKRGRKVVGREGEIEPIVEVPGTGFGRAQVRVVKTATEDFKDRVVDVLVRQLRTRAGTESMSDLVDRLGRIIEMRLPEECDIRTEEARKILVALSTRLGIG